MFLRDVSGDIAEHVVNVVDVVGVSVHGAIGNTPK